MPALGFDDGVEPRQQVGTLRVAALEEQAFTRLLGPLAGIMARHAETHYHADAAKSDVAAGADALPEPGSPRSGA